MAALAGLPGLLLISKNKPLKQPLDEDLLLDFLSGVETVFLLWVADPERGRHSIDSVRALLYAVRF